MLDQTGRQGQLTTALGKTALCLAQINANEALSELFDFEIEAVSENGELDLDALIGQPAHVALDAGALGKRFFHGLVVEAGWDRTEHDLHHYRLTLRPWLWLLGKTTDCRIHHEKTVVDIIRETFTRRGFTDFRFVTTQSYPKLHYTVQYRETDLNFVSRLMELHGLYYFFEHTEQKHTLIIADAAGAHQPAPGLAKVVFNPLQQQQEVEREATISVWLQQRGLRSGKVELTDYNHLTPNAQMKAAAKAAARYKHADLEVFDYPGPHVKQSDGEFYARIRLEAEQAVDKRRSASGVAVPLFAGAKVALERHPRSSENADYLAVRVAMAFGPQLYRTDRRGEGTEPAYTGEYVFQKLDVPFRAPFVTEKPLIHSLQTALVVGAEGEEIDCDDHGRILVHFYWDRHNDKSCRLRVSQVWGSQTWGAQIIPRIGMEVMVAYADGDPDRPIIVGTLPNPQTNKVPYELPANKTRMVWRSNSHKSPGFNELSFEDKTGGENLFMHAQKDKTTRVRHNHTERVDKHQVSSVGSNRSLEVGGNQKTEVGGSMNITVGGTGGGALALMGQLAGLAPMTAGLLQQAGSIAGGGGAGLGVVAGTLAGSALGFFGGGGLGARSGVVDGPTPRDDAGTALAQSGTGMGDAASGLFDLPGIMNTIVGSFKTDSVGIARTEQIGVAKVTNVGATSLEQVGKFKKIAVGEEFVIEVGDSKFVMKKDGTVLILGKTFNFIATDHVQIKGKPIDLN
ncbi:MAG: type VI secretion system Vgr family protein [Beijerinckiaceae bacterium]